MDTEMKHSLFATKDKEQYDEAAKRLLRHKSILAHILIRTIDEFKGMDWREVENLIEGEPLIGAVPVGPGLTNKAYSEADQGDRQIIGLNTESAEQNEGLTRFDSLFHVRTKEGTASIIMNIEAQKDEPDRYPILNRAIYYASRMISSQKAREFTKQRYGEIKKVYSIWICMNKKECVCNHIHLTNDRLLGTYEWKGNLDLFNIIMIGVPNDLPERNEQYELHRLLAALFSRHLDVSDRINIIRDEYDIPTEVDIGEEMKEMCNLSDGVWEEAMTVGIAQGIEKGIAQGIAQGRQDAILKLYRKGLSVEWIAEVQEMSIEEVQNIVTNS